MAAYSIPPGYRAGFGRFARLTEAQYDKFARALETCEPASDISLVADRVVAASALPPEDVFGMVAAVLSAAALRAREGLTSDEMAEALTTSELDVTPKAAARFAPRLMRVLTSANLRLISRAIDLVTAEDRVLLTSRVLTDLRPVFPDPDAGGTGPLAPLGSLVVHSLRLEYQEAGQIRTFVVALDGADIAKLREALDRADRKAAGVAQVAQAAGLTDLSQSLRGTKA